MRTISIAMGILTVCAAVEARAWGGVWMPQRWQAPTPPPEKPAEPPPEYGWYASPSVAFSLDRLDRRLSFRLAINGGTERFASMHRSTRTEDLHEYIALDGYASTEFIDQHVRGERQRINTYQTRADVLPVFGIPFRSPNAYRIAGIGFPLNFGVHQQFVTAQRDNGIPLQTAKSIDLLTGGIGVVGGVVSASNPRNDGEDQAWLPSVDSTRWLIFGGPWWGTSLMAPQLLQATPTKASGILIVGRYIPRGAVLGVSDAKLVIRGWIPGRFPGGAESAVIRDGLGIEYAEAEATVRFSLLMGQPVLNPFLQVQVILVTANRSDVPERTAASMAISFGATLQGQAAPVYTPQQATLSGSVP